MNTMYNKLMDYMDQIKIIDTHEHLMPESHRLEQNHDFSLMFANYCPDDLRSIGMSQYDINRFVDGG